MLRSVSRPGYRLITRARRAAVVVLTLAALAGYGCPAVAACIGSTGEVAVAACRSELTTNPRNLEVRLALSTALHRSGKKDEALKVLDEGLAIFRGDEASRSVLEEKRWIIQQQRDTAPASNAAIRVKIIKCTTLKGAAALKACDEGLESQPDNPDLLAGRGDALLGLSPPNVIDAIGSYRKALATGPADVALKQKLARAESARQKIVSECMDGRGSSALAACDRGLLKGATDEAAIHARRGDLLVAMKQESRALGAYRSAQRLDPGNAAVRRAIGELTAATQQASAAPAPKPKPKSEPRQAPTAQAEPVKRAAPEPVLPPVPDAPAPPALARGFSNAPLSPGVTY
jgi:tetratricopeptide (TPR) repeat protein